LKERPMASPDAPPVFSIQHFCLHDGPGIRSVIFFKGCPLRCDWCQNPESWKREPEIGFKEKLCISCGRCEDACPADAEKKPVFRDDFLCQKCFSCTDDCPSGALVRLGVRKSADEIIGEVTPEFPLYRESGGGVTFSGGEPALHPDFCAGLAKKLRARKIHVAMETSGMFSPDAAKRLLREIDLVLFDIKLFTDKDHHEYCKSGNDVIKKNLKQLAGIKSGRPGLWPRLPLVPGVTGTADNVTAWAALLRRLGIRAVTIVPYHRMGNDKRSWLAGIGAAPEYSVPSQDEIAAATEIFRRHGISPCLPGEEDWKMMQGGCLDS
jgi:glycyl-radical enzyme activating protein